MRRNMHKTSKKVLSESIKEVYRQFSDLCDSSSKENSSTRSDNVLPDILKQMKELIDQNLEAFSLNCPENTDLFCFALSKGEEDIINLLLNAGSNVNGKNSKGETPLHFAAMGMVKEAVQYLLGRGANKDEKNAEGNTPLHLAAMNGYRVVVQYLLRIGANKDEKNAKGNTPFHLAAMNGGGVVFLILYQGNADIKCRNKDEKTPLDVAVGEINVEFYKAKAKELEIETYNRRLNIGAATIIIAYMVLYYLGGINNLWRQYGIGEGYYEKDIPKSDSSKSFRDGVERERHNGKDEKTTTQQMP